MLVLLSPAKKLDFDSTVRTTLYSQPQFIDEAAALVDVLKQYSEEDLASLMKLSPALAKLNVERFHEWVPRFDLTNSRQAFLAFAGDVYDKLEAATLSDEALEWAQQRVVMLSGLYGILRPLDLMQPYRLEMGTRLPTDQGKNLYEYWGDQITQALNQQLEVLPATDDPASRTVINLASAEYFKAVKKPLLDAPVVDCVFQDYKNGDWKVIGFHAKRARGLMTRFIIDKSCSTPQDLLSFNSEGYAYSAEQSSDQKLVFRRQQ